MEIKKKYELTDTEKAEIESLVERCRRECSVHLSFPYEEGTSFYLLYDPGLTCALALILPEVDGAAAECAAFTLPCRQRLGYFTALFHAAGEEFEELDLYFLTDHSNIGAKKALEALNAELDHSEYRMERELGQNPDTGRPSGPLLSSPAPRNLCVSVEKAGNAPAAEGSCQDLIFHLSLPPGADVPQGGRTHALPPESLIPALHPSGGPPALPSENGALGLVPAGSCRATLFDGGRKTACFYSFEICPELRNRGLGGEALRFILEYLRALGVSSVSLHVSGSNKTALHLYKKTGFRITETLSYYLY